MISYLASRDIDLVTFDFDRYPFREWFCQQCETKDLEAIHVLRCVTPDSYRDNFNELSRFSSKNAEQLGMFCRRFIEAELVPFYGEIAGFQAIPTVRFHFAISSSLLEEEKKSFAREGAKAFLKRFYWDRCGIFHRDKDYGLPKGAMNLWIPVSPAIGTGALWLGGKNEFGRDAMPVDVLPGQAICFDGAERWHGALWNTSDVSRLSLDFRIVFKRGPWHPGCAEESILGDQR